MFKEFALQDAGTLEGTQMALESRAVPMTFPLSDQEILVRHLHKRSATGSRPTARKGTREAMRHA